ncbi:MAG TPA: hypothetical protein VN934_05795 [Candidatus Tumulicola sp.]|nr:hypothetical protein [Candidatus Tumulicola sp.]
MLNTYGGFPAFDIMYDTGGNLLDPAAESEMLANLASSDPKTPASGTTDLFIISHGWNNNIDEARALYAQFFQSVQSMLRQYYANKFKNRKIAIMTIFWPSKRFTEPTEIPGGAAALADPDAALNSVLDGLKTLFPDPQSAAKIDHARNQIPNLEVSQSAQNDFVFALKSLLPPPRGPRDEGLDESRAALDDPALNGHQVLQNLSIPIMPVLPPVGQSAALGSATSFIGNVISGIKQAAANFGNLLTYYTMKDRAGIIGSGGVKDTVQKILVGFPSLRVHLVGHSFGGRLVTAAASALPAGSRGLSSMSLLQAAYSHNGLAQNWNGQGVDGAFRNVVSAPEVHGPVLITHSLHDMAVGLAYPLASRLMNQAAAALVGGPGDTYGGMGRNGAQHTPEAFNDDLAPVGAVYQALPTGQWIRNLNGDGPPPKPTITSHGDIAKSEIAYAILDAI